MNRFSWLVIVLAVSPALGETVYLKDGTSIEGEIHRADRGWEVRTPDGKTITVPEDQVQSMVLGKGSGQASADDASGRLASLRRAAESLSNPSAAIARYEQFLKQYGTTTAAAEARKDLKVWQDRQAAGMARVGGKWLDHEQLQTLDEKNLARSQQAKTQIKDGKLTDASALVDQMLADDPENTGALYLKGVLLNRQGQFAQARKLFEQVLGALPDHGPTLNDAAALQWRMRAYGLAVNNYEKAMMAMPLTPRIHDNVAEILNDVPHELSRSPVLKRLAKRYQDTEPQLEQAMARAGWYRWGSTWVDERQAAKLKEQQAAAAKKIADLQKESDKLGTEVQNIDARIESNKRMMATIDSRRTGWDTQGNLIQMPLPDEYYRLETDNQNLAAQRREAARKVDDLKSEAERVQSEAGTPPYTRQLKLMEEDFAPVVTRSGTPAATQPASDPAASPETR